MLSVQIWDKARAAIPDVEEQIERGEFGQLHAWLRENIYALGRKLTPAETVERVVGGPIDPQPYLAYLRDKLGHGKLDGDGEVCAALASRAHRRAPRRSDASNSLPAPSRRSASARSCVHASR